jgi:acetyl-CoA acetyltransferase
MKGMREVFIAGAGITRFDRYDGQKGRPLREFYDLGAEAIQSALSDAAFTAVPVPGIRP